MAEPAPAQKAPPQAAPPTAAKQQAPGGGTAAGAAGNAALFGLLEDSGDFVVDIAGGVRLAADWISGDAKAITVKLDRVANAVPGLKLREAIYRPKRNSKRLTLKATVAIPHVEAKDFQFHVSKKGKPSFNVSGLRTTLGAIKSPKIGIKLDQEKNLSATIKVGPKKLAPEGLSKSQLKVEGEGVFTLNNGRFSGAVGADLDYPRLGTGRVDLVFSEVGKLSGSGHVELTTPFLKSVRAEMSVGEDGSLAGELRAKAADIKHPIPGLQLTAGEVFLKYENGMPSGGLESLVLSYPGFASAMVTANIEKGAFTGKGDFDVSVAQLAEVKGKWAFKKGALTGKVTVSSKDFPEGLPIESGSITAMLGGTGAVSFKGEVGITLGPAGSGQLRAAYTENGEVMIGATVDLTVPGLSGATVTVNYVNGALEGDADIPVDLAVLPGITGDVHVQYREGRWAGETELSYEADNGKLQGTVRVTVTQTEEGTLQVGGEGQVTAQLMPKLQGTLTATILPEGGIDVSGAIEVTEPIPLFDEKRFDKELFKHSQNIPLWAILVAVIRIRAGIRAGIGPGVFRNIKVEGSYTIGQDGEPSFSISGEMFIPAFVEGYVAFGAGLGLDVVLGSLTGGIEGVATAGIYGAISVIPELAYENGDYRIEGTATMAAGARLKIGLNAWAEVEALWVTVWENDWELAEWVWSVGPDLGLQAKMAYTFGSPEAPSLDFTTSDIDTDSMIQDAMPKDGPAPSGAKEALKNKAEWKGALRKPKPPPPPLPPDLTAQAAKKETPPAPKKKKKPKKPGPKKDAAAKPTAESKGKKKAAEDAAKKPPGAEQTKPEKDVPTAHQKRYPKPITLKTLDEPPAPMPRTKAQQKEDEKAAAQAVRLVSTAADSTDTLDDVFPRIKKRFGLSAVGFVGDLDKGLKIRTSANPYTDIPAPRKPVRSIDPDFAGKEASTFKYKTVKLAQTVGATSVDQTMGIEMEAAKLGPNHGQGAEPRSSNLGSIMGVLPSGKGKGDKKYIRGHLLNADLGGPADDKNLYPITGQANADHLNEIETDVKQLVNDDLYWVYYKVKILGREDIQTDTNGINFINTDFTAEARILNSDKSSTPRRKVTIRSHYRPASEKTKAKIEAFREATEPTKKDPTGALTPGPKSKQEGASFDRSKIKTTKDKDLTPGTALLQAYDALRAAAASGSAFDWINWEFLEKRVVAKVKNLGLVALQTGEDAYYFASGDADKDLSLTLKTKQQKVNFDTVKSRATDIKTVAGTVKAELDALNAFLSDLPSPPHKPKWTKLAAVYLSAPPATVLSAANEIAEVFNGLSDADKIKIRKKFRQIGGVTSNNPLLKRLRAGSRFGV